MAISPFLHTHCKVQSCRPHRSSRSESEFHAPGSACGGNAEAGNSDDPACNKTLKLAGLSEDFTCFHHMKGKDPLHHCRKIISCPSIYPSSLQPFWNARKVSEYVRMYQVVTLLLVQQETNWGLHNSTGLTRVEFRTDLKCRALIN